MEITPSPPPPQKKSFHQIFTITKLTQKYLQNLIS